MQVLLGHAKIRRTSEVETEMCEEGLCESSFEQLQALCLECVKQPRIVEKAVITTLFDYFPSTLSLARI